MKHVKILKPGDTIGIAASASPFDRNRFMKGIRALERLGFKTFYRHDIFDQTRYLAGTDKRRAAEFTELIGSKNVNAVMFARGGYGSQRIIPLLDANFLREHPKPVIGFSDLTALLAFLRQSCGVPTFYGPVITQLGMAKDELTGKTLFSALTCENPLGPVPMKKTKTIRPGNAEGVVVGGCLSLINSSMGTPYELQTKDCILFIEEINEKVYVMDRMLTQLKNSGVLNDVRGIIFGSIIPPQDEPHDIESMIRDVLVNFEGPILLDFPAGHTDGFVTLPLGAKAQLSASIDTAPMLSYTTNIL